MTQKDKLIKRFQAFPKYFTYNKLIKLLSMFGYEEIQGRGSRVKFFNKDTQDLIILHKPHPGSILKQYQLREIDKNLFK